MEPTYTLELTGQELGRVLHGLRVSEDMLTRRRNKARNDSNAYSFSLMIENVLRLQHKIKHQARAYFGAPDTIPGGCGKTRGWAQAPQAAEVTP